MLGNIQQLESEIHHLEKAIKTQQEKNRKLQLWKQSQTGRQLSDTNEDVVKANLESLRYQIDLLGEITGVNLVETKTEILERGETMCRKRKQTEGYCGQVEFKLEMEIEESMKYDTAIEARILNLAIAASENITEDLENTIERSCQSCQVSHDRIGQEWNKIFQTVEFALAAERNAHGFLRLLQPYNQWLSAREKTFKHFTTKYPNIAKSDSIDELCLNHTTKKISFTIEWRFTVTDTCLVIPDLQLNVKVPKKVSNNKVLHTAPDMFKLMLKELGIETAIHSLITLLLET